MGGPEKAFISWLIGAVELSVACGWWPQSKLPGATKMPLILQVSFTGANEGDLDTTEATS